uniref:GH03109p n=1 Tax=Drosophila melanogaster TaxID=7227 RepID=Q95TC2_DROME|nr:GH03109p [Drosophila melanogaster]
MYVCTSMQVVFYDLLMCLPTICRTIYLPNNITTYIHDYCLC